MSLGFVGKDVAEVLGYANPKNAVPKHVSVEDKLTHQISASGQRRNVTTVKIRTVEGGITYQQQKRDEN